MAGYFDQHGTPVIGKERSTVGSASATGSMGGRTTWASGSGSDVYEGDKMSVGTGPEAEAEPVIGDGDETSSVGGMSEEGNASLVGFGEGASSTVDGPVSSVPPAVLLQMQREREMQGRLGPKGVGFVSGRGGSGEMQAEKDRAKNLDGVTYDRNVVDTTARNPLPAISAPGGLAARGYGEAPAPGSNQGTPAPRHAHLSGTETAERIVRERRLGKDVGDRDGDVAMGDAGEEVDMEK